MSSSPDEANHPSAALSSADDFARAEAAAAFIRQRLSVSKPSLASPAIAVVLGSGLGSLASSLVDSLSIPYAEIPHFPRPTVQGHAGQLVIGKLGPLTLAVMQGRVHLYEGYSARQVAFPVRVLSRLGVRRLVLTNAAGAINPLYRPGSLVLVSDHINLQGSNPLTGANDERFGPRFPALGEAYSLRLRELARESARALNINLPEGVYAAVSGPNYETPAEIRFLHSISADLVGMSTAAEVIAARHLGIELLAISSVTNLAAGISPTEITHAEVLVAGLQVADTLLALLRSLLPKIAALP